MKPDCTEPRLFGDPQGDRSKTRRAVTKVLILLYGGITMFLEGLLDVAYDAQLIADLQEMVREAV